MIHFLITIQVTNNHGMTYNFLEKLKKKVFSLKHQYDTTVEYANKKIRIIKQLFF